MYGLEKEKNNLVGLGGGTEMKVEEIKDLKNLLEGSSACGDPLERIVFVDADLSKEEKRVAVIHEVLEIWLLKRVKHSTYDGMAIDIIESLVQLGELD